VRILKYWERYYIQGMRIPALDFRLFLSSAPGRMPCGMSA